MAIRQLTPSFTYICDACGAETAHGSLDTRPPYWSQLRIGRNNYDANGVAIGDGTIDCVLCCKCAHEIVDSITQCLIRMHMHQTMPTQDGKVLPFKQQK